MNDNQNNVKDNQNNVNDNQNNVNDNQNNVNDNQNKNTSEIGNVKQVSRSDIMKTIKNFS